MDVSDTYYVYDRYGAWNLRRFINLNPMTPVIQAYKDILYYKQAPQLETLLQASVLGVVCLVVGNIVFNKLEPNFVEEL